MRLVGITGMHRSGTSLAARVLNLLGVDLGPEDAMMAATPDNPRGYWEAAAITELDNDIIEELGGRWHRLPAFPEGWAEDPALEPFRARARDLLDELFAGAQVAGFKDPRLSLTLPFWRTVTDVDATVLVLRHPAEVADSLHRRDGFDLDHGAGLWLDHTSGAWIFDPNRVMVTYDELLTDPAATARRVAEALDLPTPDDTTLAEIAAFGDPDLRRSRAEAVGADVGPQLATALAVFELVTGPSAELAGPVLAQLFADRNATRLRQNEIHGLEHELRVHQRDLRTALRERDQRHDEVRELRRHLNQRTNEREQFRRQAERWQREYDKLRNRKVVKALLTAVQPLKPAFQYAREKGWVAKVREITGESEPKQPPHEPATREEAAQLQAQLDETAPGSDRAQGPLVTIAVLNRNGQDHLARLIPGLGRTTYRSFELVVVDNGSDDGSPDWLEAQAGQVDFDLRVVRNAENRSFSEGNNQAIAAANGEHVLLLNNDIEPATPGWLGHLVDTLEQRDATAVGARLIYPRRPGLDNAGDTVHPDLTLQHRGVHFDGGVDGIPRGRNLGAGEDPLSATAAGVREVPAATAACLLVRGDALEEVGGLTEGYQYGTEDVDLCMKLREAGGTIVYDGQAVLWHHEYGTQNEAGRERKRNNRIHNRKQFVDTWGPRVFREVLADRLNGEERWSLTPFHIAITVTKDDPDAGWGDYYTAHELGDALADLGYQVSYVERYDDRWYDLDDGIDALIVLLDAFELPRARRDIITIAWVRNWTDRWVQRAWFDDYDLILASSKRSKHIIERDSAKKAHLFPLATNPDRFHPREPDPSLAAEVLFTGNYWDRHRDIIDALPALRGVADVRVHGSNWEKVPSMAGFSHGPLDYRRLPDAYSSATVVVDDTAGHAKPYAAVNSRVFDALAAGALVVSDNAEGVRDLFGPDFPTWADGDDLRRQIRTLRDDPEAAAQLAERYRKVVLRDHTYAHRAEQLRDLLLEWCEAEKVGIAIGVPKREVVDEWGDYHYARDLQHQLELAGHPTRVNILPEWEAAYTGREDVILHLFGLSELTTRPGQVNVLWNISHPEKVTPELVGRYDLAFTASDRFAEQLAAKVDGVEVHPLHQCTEPARFRPDSTGPSHELLFVANSRKVRRRIVDDLTAGGDLDHELAIYGTNWTPDLVDPRYVAGEHVPNKDLYRYYAGASIVLNDHWDDMREHGFLSNRLYDALACGSLVVSDHVDGIEDEFDGAIVTYTGPDDLRAKIDHYLSHPGERHELADRGRELVLAQHTFAQRTATILAKLRPLLADRRPGITAALGWPIPPSDLRFMGETREGFLAVGEAVRADLAATVGLGSQETVVDVGAGYGRLAHALLRDRDFAGRYVGFDVLERHMGWCEDHLGAPTVGRFSFRHLDVRNDRYNPDGAMPADEMRLELPDASADVVVATSLFTHMYGDEIRRYLAEMRRILTPGGRLYATFLILDEDARAAVVAGRAGYRFGVTLDEHTLAYSDDDPLRAIAFDRAWLDDVLAGAGLRLRQPVRHGRWGRPDTPPSADGDGATGWQDLVVAQPLRRADADADPAPRSTP